MFDELYSFLYSDGNLRKNVETMVNYVRLLKMFLEFSNDLGLGSKENEIFGPKSYIGIDDHYGPTIHKIVRIFQYLNIDDESMKEYDRLLYTMESFINKINTYLEKDFLFKDYLNSRLKSFSLELNNFYNFLHEYKQFLIKDREERLVRSKEIEKRFKELKKQYRSLVNSMAKYLNLLDEDIKNIFLLNEFENILLRFLNGEINEKTMIEGLKKFYDSKYYWIIENDESKELISKELKNTEDITILEEKPVKDFIGSLIKFIEKINS